ncbi:hypothetical protein [Paenibacillus beijingensis]|uniref:hypothetical protein n=1 Tax=Paenibacillus beijingensis TaxID=1126833 RepID=UPI000B0640CD|nr:hypothetical protein [Paenibacillus beijingensis]
MSSSKNHQEAHGIGQIEEQLNKQAAAAASIQGQNEIDAEVLRKAHQSSSELDEIIES